MKKVLYFLGLFLLCGCQKKMDVEVLKNQVELDKVMTFDVHENEQVYNCAKCDESSLCIMTMDEKETKSHYYKVDVTHYEVKEIDEDAYYQALGYVNRRKKGYIKEFNQDEENYNIYTTEYYLSETEKVVNQIKLDKKADFTYEYLIYYESLNTRKVIHEYQSNDGYNSTIIPYAGEININGDRKCVLSYIVDDKLKVMEIKKDGSLLEQQSFDLIQDDYKLVNYSYETQPIMMVYSANPYLITLEYSNGENKKVIINDITFEMKENEKYTLVNENTVILHEYDNDKVVGTSIVDLKTNERFECELNLNGGINVSSTHKWKFNPIIEGNDQTVLPESIGMIKNNQVLLYEYPTVGDYSILLNDGSVVSLKKNEKGITIYHIQCME